MGKYFDRFERGVFNTVNRVYGESDATFQPIMATWVSIDTLASYSGPVLFNNPTHTETLDTTEFVDTDPYIEYLAPAFIGLEFRVNNSQLEIINISGTDYYVTAIHRLSDGNNFKAYVQLVVSAYGPVV